MATNCGVGGLARIVVIVAILLAGLGVETLAAQPEQMTAAAFDPVAATDAYLARVSPEAKARSDAYFEGGYWLLLWGFLYGVAVNGLLLQGRWSARMRDLAGRLTRFKPLQTWIYWVQFLIVSAVLVLPLTVYQGFYREHQYGLATQTFGAWLWDRAKGLLVGLILGGLFMVVLYGVLRRATRTWWLWGSVVAMLFQAFTTLIFPVYIAPLFNTYTPLQDEAIRRPILQMASANGMRVDRVYQMDASRQTTRISAHVSGFLGTEQIVLNDNLLKRCTRPEIEAVMGHEIGHYVLNHVYDLLLFLSLVVVGGFAFLRWAFDLAMAHWGARWGVRGVDDVAGLPLLALLLATYMFVLTPVTNTYTRRIEYEADVFGLNAARQPDAEAEVALKLGDYRKLDPSALEEWIFYDHPSGRTRILAAMRWKAARLAAGY